MLLNVQSGPSCVEQDRGTQDWTVDASACVVESARAGLLRLPQKRQNGRCTS